MFASDDLHNQFRGISHLNRVLDGLVGREESAPLIKLRENPGEHRAHYIHQQDVYINLLVRDAEVVSGVLTTDHSNVPSPTAPSTLVKISRPHMLVLFNPRSDALQIRTKRKQCPENMLVEQQEPAPLGDVSEGVVKAVLTKYMESEKRIFFENHVGYMVGLLKDCHLDGIKKDEYAKATQDLRIYVYLASHPKMQRRMDLGQGTNNLFSVMTANESQFPPDTFAEKDLTERQMEIMPDPDQQHFIRNFCLTLPNGAQLAEKQIKAPLYDLEGRRSFHAMLQTILTRVDITLKALGAWKKSTEKTEWQVSENEVRKGEDLIKQLQSAMIRLNNFIVLFGKQPFGPTTSTLGPPMDLLTLHLSWLGRMAGVRTRTDIPFAPAASATPTTPVASGARLPSAHLMQPQPASTAMQAGSTQVSAQRHHGAPPVGAHSSPLASQPQVTAHIPPSRSLSPAAPYDPGSASKSEDNEAVLAAMSAEPDESDHESSDDDEELNQLCSAARRVDLADNGQSAYATCAFKLLELVSLHEHGLTQACPKVQSVADASKSRHIRITKVSVLSIGCKATENQDDPGNNKRLDFNKCLDIIFGDPGTDASLQRNQLEERITKVKVAEAKAKFMADHPNAVDPGPFSSTYNPIKHTGPPTEEEKLAKQLDTFLHRAHEKVLTIRTFSGTLHAETLLMACIVLLKALLETPALHKKMSSNEWLERNGIFGLRSTLLQLLKNPLPLLTVSKRCCSVCWSVLQEMIKTAAICPKGSVIAVPGKHYKCWGVRLPPFLLKSYVDACLKDAIAEAQKKLLQLQKLLNEEDLSSKGGDSSHASKGSNPSFAEKTPNSALRDPDDKGVQKPTGDYYKKRCAEATGSDKLAPTDVAKSSSSPRLPATPTKSMHPVPAAAPHLPGQSGSLVRKADDESDGSDHAPLSPTKRYKLDDQSREDERMKEVGD